MKKNKPKLIEELKSAENLLLEKEEALLTCKDELARLVAEQAQQQNTRPVDEELVSLKLELELAQELTEKVQSEQKKLQRKHDQAVSEIKKISQEHTQLSKEASKVKEELETAKKALKKQKKAKETVPVSSYSFRLDVYPRSEDTFQSRIEHLESGERHPLDGLDISTLIDFMGNYLPVEDVLLAQKPIPESIHPDTEVVSVQPSLNHESGEAPVPDLPETGSNQPGSTTTVKASSVVHIGPKVACKAISEDGFFPSGRPFSLQITIEAISDLHEELPAIQCNISFFAKNMDSRITVPIGIFNQSIHSLKKEATYSIESIGLPKGFYRIEQVTSFSTESGHHLPAGSVQEATFIHIT